MRCATRRKSAGATANPCPEVLGLDHIPQPKTHVKAAIRQACDAARYQRIGSTLAPQRHIGTRGFIQLLASGIDVAELPAALQSARIICEIFWGAPSSPRKAGRAIGSWVRPTPVTSTRNCAKAGNTGVAAMAASEVRREASGKAAWIEDSWDWCSVFMRSQYVPEDRRCSGYALGCYTYFSTSDRIAAVSICITEVDTGT